MRLMWVDDDCYGLLHPLGRMLERKGFSVKKATNLADALRQIREAHGAPNTRFRALLVDILLPKAQGGASLASDLGINLAEESISFGVKSVAFLTVVRQDEIIDKYADLVKNYPGVGFSYFDKTTLLTRGEIEELTERLRAGYNGIGAEDDL